MRTLRAALAAAALAWAAVTGAPSAQAAHAYAQFGDIKYPPGFSHFDYVNPAAPKGGRISLVAPLIASSFDKYNPFTLKGTEPPGLEGLLFDTLLTGNMDEPATAYGLLAEDVDVAADGRSVTFRLNPKARFHNGDPVLARDVKHSFDQLTGPGAAPQYRAYFAPVKGATVLGERLVRFDFKEANRELPLIVGGLPVFSHKWGSKGGKPQPLDAIVTEYPIASGPYRIGKVDFGKEITYERDPAYWARDLNVRRGQFNFDRITYQLYKDNVAAFEAFKAGEFDFIQAFIAKDWARQYQGGKFASGELLKREWRHGNAVGFQGFIFNTRLAKFSDPRVRRAIGLAMDFEWMNRQLFYGAYTRVRGYFTGSEYEATGLPQGDELAVLQSLKARPPRAVLEQPVPLPPTTTPPGSLRANLRLARQLLAEAGWTYRDGALRNAKGEPFTIEFMDTSGSMGRVVNPYMRTLEKLGFQPSYRQIDYAVYEQRMRRFEFEVISSRTLGRLVPGSELTQYFRADLAKQDGSSNLGGVQDPVVDELLRRIDAAQSRPELAANVRALDRVLRHGYYAVPHWYSAVHRVAYRAHRFAQPQVVPRYYQPEGWALSTWWAAPAGK